MRTPPAPPASSATRGASNVGYGFGQTQNGKLLFTVFGWQDYVTTNAHLAINQWTHVAVVFDHSNDANFYVNGQFVQRVEGSFGAGLTTAPLNVGRNPSADTQMWDGAIADVRIWNTMRTPAELTASYNTNLEGTEPGLLANYRLDEGAATTAIDTATGSVSHSVGNAGLEIAGTPCPCVKGDANCDLAVNFFDIDPFVLSLFSLPAWQSQFCGDSTCSIDMDCSGEINFFDIDPFVEALFGNPLPCP